ncbi:hypothetical protein Tco_0543054 [Tanacetum coccineum]
MGFYVNERTKGTIGDLDEYKEPCEENTKKTYSDTFYKPYLDAQEAKDIYEVINKEYSLIPIPARRDIDNPDELCRTEEFTVVRHSIGNDEEFVTIVPYMVNDKKGKSFKDDMIEFAILLVCVALAMEQDVKGFIVLMKYQQVSKENLNVKETDLELCFIHGKISLKMYKVILVAEVEDL